MKKMFLFLLTCVNLQVFAQHDSHEILARHPKMEIQDFSVGMICGSSGTYLFDEHYEKPFNDALILWADVGIITLISYHEAYYNFSANALGMVNGKFLPKNFDTYLVFEKELNHPDWYIGWGVERLFEIKDESDPKFAVGIFPFAELGLTSHNVTFSVGVIMRNQYLLFKRAH